MNRISNVPIEEQRNKWTFTYLASELYPKAHALYVDYYKRQLEIKKILSGDVPTRFPLSYDRIRAFEKEAEECEGITNQCLVWEHEFKRDPGIVYHLSIEDVRFFRLVTPYYPTELMNKEVAVTVVED